MPSQQSRDVAAGVGLPSPLEEIHDPAFEAAGARLLLKRDDVVDPLIPGNKLRKLKYNLEAAAEEGAARLLTLGWGLLKPRPGAGSRGSPTGHGDHRGD